MKKLTLILLIIPLILSYSQSEVKSELSAKRLVSYSAKSPGEKSELSFTVKSGGEEKYTLTRLNDYDEPFPVLKLFDNGTAALISSFSGKIELLDANGNLNNELYLYKDIQPDYERTIYSSISEDLLVLGVSAPTIEKCEVYLFDNNGQFINSFKIDSDYISGILLSESNDLVAISTYTWDNESLVEAVYLYSARGDYVNSVRGQFNSAKITDELLIGYTNKSCFIADISNLTDIVYSKASGGEIIHDIMLYENEIYLAVSNHPVLKEGKWLYNGARVDVLNKTLQKKTTKVIQTNEFGGLSLSTRNGRLSVQADDAQIIVE